MGRRGAAWRIVVVYRYEFEGRAYVGDSYDFASSPGRRAWREEAVSKIPRGTRTSCYVNPNDPRESVLNPQPPIGDAVSPVAIPIIFVALGVVGVIWNVRQVNIWRRARRIGRLRKSLH
jgi:hypothetical protein